MAHVTRHLIAQILSVLPRRQPPPHVDVLKYDRNQPRGEKGTPTGGRWVKDVSAGGQWPPTHVTGFGSHAWGQAPPGMERMQGNASYAAIMNAPTGTGFGNTPRGVNLPEPPPPPTATAVTSVLATGSVKESHPLGSGTANATVKVEFEDGTEAIYKPEIGENWGPGFANSDIEDYITNKDFSLAEREATAYEVGHELFGDKNPVPETVHRTSLPGVDLDNLGSGDDEGGGGMDPDELRNMYQSYREKAIDNADVGEQMEALYDAAKDEHAEDIKRRADEIAEIWNEEVKDFPDDPRYGSESMLRAHPAFPLGSVAGFERRAPITEALDPLDIITDLDINVEGKLNREERDAVRRKIRERLEEGYQELGEVDEDAAKEHLDRDKWLESHADTENRLLDSAIQSFDSWKQHHGYHDYDSEQGGGEGGRRNDDAPHPEGGSLQRWLTSSGYGRLTPESGARMAVLDYALGTMDRHDANLMWANGEPVAIDNGYSFPAAGAAQPDGFQFRSVAVREWLRNTNHVSEAIRAPLLERVKHTDWQALLDRHPGMNEDERDAFLGRINNLEEALMDDEGLSALWRGLNLMR